jgi:uroporphyrinogen-III synthase
VTVTVVLTASAGAFPGLRDALRAIPVIVEELPLMTFTSPEDWGPVDAALRALGRYQAIALTSPRAARALAERAKALDIAPPAGRTVWASGSGTEEALDGRLGPVRRPDERDVGREGAALALAAALLASGVRGPVLFPCGDTRREELPDRLRGGGLEVDEVICYRSKLADLSDARHAAERARVLVVASPSVAELLARACPPEVRPALLAVGPTTAAAARASGWTPARVAERPSVEALAAGVRALVPSS